MANRIEYRYNPIDLKPNKAVGVMLPLGGSPIFKLSYTTEEQAVSNLKNLLLTRKGERVFQPLFGSDIYSLLFENMDSELDSNLEDKVSIKVSFKVTEQGSNQTIILEVDSQGELSIA